MIPSAIPPETSASMAAELLPDIGSSAGSCSTFEVSIPYNLISLASSLTVITESTSLIPFLIMPSRLASNFIAIQGVADTEYIFSGFTPACSATKVLMSAPATCWGDLTVENRGKIDGINCSAYLTQAGQADIYKGVLSFSSIFVFSSSAISEIQISVPVPVMKTLSNPILRRMEFSILSKSLLYLICLLYTSDAAD